MTVFAEKRVPGAASPAPSLTERGDLALEAGETELIRGLATLALPGPLQLEESSALILTDRRLVWIDPTGGAGSSEGALGSLRALLGGRARGPQTPLAGQVELDEITRVALPLRGAIVEIDVAGERIIARSWRAKDAFALYTALVAALGDQHPSAEWTRG
jgi:hypothetical protein